MVSQMGEGPADLHLAEQQQSRRKELHVKKHITNGELHMSALTFIPQTARNIS